MHNQPCDLKPAPQPCHKVGFRVQGAWLRVQGSGLRVQGTGFRVQGSGFGVRGSGFWVQGSGLRAQGSGLRVQGSGYSTAAKECPPYIGQPPYLEYMMAYPAHLDRGSQKWNVAMGYMTKWVTKRGATCVRLCVGGGATRPSG